MVNLKVIDDLRKRGKKTNFLVFTPFLKMFPLSFEESYHYEHGVKKRVRLAVKIELYLDVNNLINIQVLMTEKLYIKKNKKIKLYVTVESLNEYSNDEHFLPNISTISIIKTKGELINKIKEELYLGNLNKEEVDLIFNKLEKNILRKKYIVKDEEKNSFLNEKNKAINKLVKYFETIESG